MTVRLERDATWDDSNPVVPAVRARDQRRRTVSSLFSSRSSLVILLVFAAFAIDVGAVYNHRRQDQNAADGAALAAAGDLENGVTAAVATAKTCNAHATLGQTLSASEWNSCVTDPGALAYPNSGRG